MTGLLLGLAALLGGGGHADAACTQAPAWYRQTRGLSQTLLLTEPGAERVTVAGGLVPWEFGNMLMPLPGAPGYLVRASNFAGPDSAALAGALTASAGHLVLVPWPSMGCSEFDAGSDAITEDWWPATDGRMVLFARLRPRFLWLRQVPTFDVVDGDQMPYSSTFSARAGYPFRERGAAVASETLFDFFRQIPPRDSLPCAAARGMQSLADWRQANPDAAKLRSLKVLLKNARQSLKDQQRDKRALAACS